MASRRVCRPYVGGCKLKGRTITVNKSIEYASDRTPKLKHVTKTAAGMRTIDIPQKLVDYMARMPQTDSLIAHCASGGIMAESAWAKLRSSYMRLLNIKYGAGILKDADRLHKSGPKTHEMTIPHFTLHWLRHTYCTLLYFAGGDVVQACTQMGHVDVSTTLGIYTHLDAAHKRRSVDKLDQHLAENTVFD